MIKETFLKRREILHTRFMPIQNKFIFAEFRDCKIVEDIDEYLAESVASGCEGLMVKTLEHNSTYEPDKRTFKWLKVKKDYLASAGGDSVDAVIVGAFHGVGKRKGF